MKTSSRNVHSCVSYRFCCYLVTSPHARYRCFKPVGTETSHMERCIPPRLIPRMRNRSYHKLARWLMDILEPTSNVLKPDCVKDHGLIWTSEYTIKYFTGFSRVVFCRYRLAFYECVSPWGNGLFPRFDSWWNISLCFSDDYLRRPTALCTMNIRIHFENIK